MEHASFVCSVKSLCVRQTLPPRRRAPVVSPPRPPIDLSCEATQRPSLVVTGMEPDFGVSGLDDGELLNSFIWAAGDPGPDRGNRDEEGRVATDQNGAPMSSGRMRAAAAPSTAEGGESRASSNDKGGHVRVRRPPKSLLALASALSRMPLPLARQCWMPCVFGDMTLVPAPLSST